MGIYLIYNIKLKNEREQKKTPKLYLSYAESKHKENVFIAF
jgi:hypothetical protein